MRNVVVFVHVLLAVAMLGPVLLLPSISATFRNKPPAPVIRLIGVIQRQFVQFLVLQLLTGLWLVHLGDDGWGAWVIVSLVLVAVMAVLAVVVDRPKLAAASAAAGTNDLTAVEALRIPLKVTAPIQLLLAAVVLYLMVAKPG